MDMLAGGAVLIQIKKKIRDLSEDRASHKEKLKMGCQGTPSFR